MSTYYYFACKKCKKLGGFFSRQAWGWGNADVIDSFQFIMKHTGSCGEEHIIILSEFVLDNYTDEGYTDDTSDELKQYYPRSTDWREGESDKRYEEHKAAKEVE